MNKGYLLQYKAEALKFGHTEALQKINTAIPNNLRVFFDETNPESLLSRYQLATDLSGEIISENYFNDMNKLIDELKQLN